MLKMTKKNRFKNTRRHLFDEEDDICVHCGAQAQDAWAKIGCEAHRIKGNAPSYGGFALTPRELAAGVTTTSKAAEVFGADHPLSMDEFLRRLRDFNRRFYPHAP
jgi:hypothetical protein